MKRIFLISCVLMIAGGLLAQHVVDEGSPTFKRKSINVVLDSLNQYIDQTEVYDAGILADYLDHALAACKKSKEKNAIIGFYFQYFNTHNPDTDPLLIHLYDTYDRSWIPEGSEKRYERKIEGLRKIVPGAHVPELIAHDRNGQACSTRQIKRHYTVLWFWDPDCDHCQEMTPILHKFYVENAERWDMEVFAVEVNEDHDRWVAFSDANDLWDWVNLSTSMGKANLDFVEYFDIMTTPVMFLIDNTDDFAIIARQITLDELFSFFED